MGELVPRRKRKRKRKGGWKEEGGEEGNIGIKACDFRGREKFLKQYKKHKGSLINLIPLKFRIAAYSKRQHKENEEAIMNLENTFLIKH